MRLYTCFTETHRRLLYDHFLPSLVRDEYLVTVKQFRQQSKSGNYMTAGYPETTRDKISMVIDAIDVAQKEGDEYFVLADCDVQFFGRTKELLLEAIEDYDIAAQTNVRCNTPCTGFFICRASDKMRRFFEAVLPRIDAKYHDQHIVIDMQALIRVKLLGKQFWSNCRRWRPGQPLNVPDDIVMHHANFTMGVADKLAQLRLVKERVQQVRVGRR
jgi:hypothetical protein